MTAAQQQELFYSPIDLANLPQPTSYYVQQCHDWELEFRVAIEAGDREHIDDAVSYVRMYSSLAKMALLRDLQLEVRRLSHNVGGELGSIGAALERGQLLGDF